MKTTKQAGSSVEQDRTALLMTQFFRYALGELPLSERMTAEEKERVRETYVAARDGYWDECNDMNIAVESVLEDIFGADFFKEGE